MTEQLEFNFAVGDPEIPDRRDALLEELYAELARQDEKWGLQNHPVFSSSWPSDPHYNARLRSESWKAINDQRVSRGKLAWDGILFEEVEEALAEKFGTKDFETEMIQTAAVALAIADHSRRERGGYDGSLAGDRGQEAGR